MIKGLDHTALSVSSLEKSLAFYKGILGFELIRTIECAPEMRLGEVVGIPGCSAKIAHLQKGAMMLELFEYVKPRGRKIPENKTQADNGWSHLGFTSTDVRADFADLKGKGVSFIGNPVEFRPDVWIVYFHGPDGEVCELRQTPEAVLVCQHAE